jgi:uncharacterized protein (DUF983 family)
MEINTFCPECENGLFLRELPKPGLIACKHCGKGREATGNGELDAQGAIARCGLCGCEEFYRQKDFNTKLGLWVVVFIVAIALIFNQYLIQILVAGAILDTVLYFALGDIVICYNCRGIYRGLTISSKVQGFDLKTHDQYEFKHKKPGETS